jgi:hypothetical protein
MVAVHVVFCVGIYSLFSCSVEINKSNILEFARAFFMCVFQINFDMAIGGNQSCKTALNKSAGE